MISFFKKQMTRFKDFLKDPLNLQPQIDTFFTKNIPELDLENKFNKLDNKLDNVKEQQKNIKSSFNTFKNKLTPLIRSVDSYHDMNVNMMWVKDIDGRFVKVNDRMTEQFSIGDFEGKIDTEVLEIHRATHGPECCELLEVCISTDEMVKNQEDKLTTVKQGCLGGIQRIYIIHKNVIKNNSGEIIGIAGMAEEFNEVVDKLICILDTKIKTEKHLPDFIMKLHNDLESLKGV